MAPRAAVVRITLGRKLLPMRCLGWKGLDALLQIGLRANLQNDGWKLHFLTVKQARENLKLVESCDDRNVFVKWCNYSVQKRKRAQTHLRTEVSGSTSVVSTAKAR